jgi:signal peptidase II
MVNDKRLFFSIALGIVLVDQIVKYAITKIQPDTSLLTIVHNTGAGFGIFQNQTILLAIISIIVASAVIYYYERIPKEKWPQVLWAVFLGGVVGNLIDRLLRGYVIDFIDLGFWPAFNVADASITISVIGLVIWYWKNDKKE